jgi:O-antigen/teichoic acid export membrane protein
MFAGQSMRLGLQATYFILIAHSLGAKNYGAFVGAAAMVGMASPFGLLGANNLLIRQVARNPELFKEAWGGALYRSIMSGGVFVIAILLAARFILPPSIPFIVVLCIAIADILALNIVLLSAAAFQAFEQLRWTSSMYVLMSLFRLAAACLLVLFHRHPTASQWAVAYGVSTAALAVTAFGVTVAKLGWPQIIVRTSWSTIRDGFYFAAGLSAATIYNDIDKTMLARLGSLEATGIYGSAYRIIEVSFTPISALLLAAYPRFFKVGAGGIGASVRFAMPYVWRGLLLTTAISLILILCSGVVPVILGSQYQAAGTALRWLAFILPLRSIHSLLADVLTSVDRQGLRTAIQIGVAILNFLVNLWLIPAYSWKGAAVSSLACDALLAVCVSFAVSVLVRRARASARGLNQLRAVV